jgi:group I intron endonuclease
VIVYLVTNRVNGKRYVGQSEISLEDRWEKHVAVSRSVRSNAYKRMPIVRAIAKHGAENFNKKVIEECDTYEAMDAAEIRWIAELDTTDPKVGYNVSKGGDAPMRGRKHSEASKRQMSVSHLALGEDTKAAMRAGQARANADPEVIVKKSEAAKRWITERGGFSEEHRTKISKANSGENHPMYGKRFGRSLNPTPHTEEAKRRMSAAHHGKILSDDHKAAIARGVVGKSSARGLNRRPVHVFQDGQHIASFLKLEFVAEDMGVSVKTMRNWLRDGKEFGDRRYVQDESTVSALRSKVR